MTKHRFNEKEFRVSEGSKVKLSKWPSKAGEALDDKEHGLASLAADVAALQESQRRLYADGTRSLLIILQGMDAAGKDGTIRHVMGSVNPQGCRVYSFKAPNDTEIQHHFLWRPMPCLPKRGMISIFNRSYYEETLVVRVHPEFLVPQNLPSVDINSKSSLSKLWKRRFSEIRAFEKTLVDNGTMVLKFFLNVSQQEQRERFLERLENPEKHWKFNARDLSERKLWPEYQRAFEKVFEETSTKNAPWFIIPADNKWYARAAIADIISSRLNSLKLRYPSVPASESKEFARLAKELRSE